MARRNPVSSKSGRPSGNKPSSRGDYIVYILAPVLAIAVIITYANHFHNGFHFDDSHSVVNNAYIRSLRNIPLFFRDATSFSSLPANQTYRPIVSTSLALDYYLGKGLDPFYFHLQTFVLFLVQGVFMYLLYRRAFSLSSRGNGGAAPAAFFAVAWYLLHPANAETINYVSARSDSISTLFIVVSLVMFVYWRTARRWHLYLVPFALGMLTKPITVTFVFLLFAWLLHFGQEGPDSTVPATTALKKTAPAFFFCVLLVWFTKKMTPPSFTPGGTAFFNYVITQPYVILHYFITFFLPVSLSADTDWRPLNSVFDGRFFAGICFLSALLFAAVFAARHKQTRPISFGIFWFLIALLPTSLFPLAEVMNDHRVFFPFIGLAMSSGWLIYLALENLSKSFSSKKIFYVPAAAVIILALSAYAYGTHKRNEVWKTDETLWRDVTEKSPQNGRGLMNYGLALMARGDFAGAGNYFMRAFQLVPRYSYLNVNLGVLKEAMGQSGEAEQYFKNAVAYDPNNPECHFFYAKFLKEHGRTQEAIAELKTAVELAPADLEAKDLLMDIYATQGNRQELAANLNPAAAGKTPEGLLDLSLEYYKAGQYEKSIQAARDALKLRPGYDLAYNNICAGYNMLKRWDKAVEACETAVRLNPENQLSRNNLAWATTHKKP